MRAHPVETEAARMSYYYHSTGLWLRTKYWNILSSVRCASDTHKSKRINFDPSAQIEKSFGSEKQMRFDCNVFVLLAKWNGILLHYMQMRQGKSNQFACTILSQHTHKEQEASTSNRMFLAQGMLMTPSSCCCCCLLSMLMSSPFGVSRWLSRVKLNPSESVKTVVLASVCVCVSVCLSHLKMILSYFRIEFRLCIWI